MILCTGCGKRIVSVEGQVLYEGKPAPDILVLFESKSASKTVPQSGLGKTDPQGKFFLQSVDSKKNGIEPGEYTAYFGWKNPVRQIIGDTPEENKGLVEAKCPYVFPESINAGKYVFTVPEKGIKDLIVNITKTDVVW